jgi:hypothetical protein
VPRSLRLARALSRDEQLVLNHVRRHGVTVPVPALAEPLGLSEAVVGAACAYLVERNLLAVSIYAVGPVVGRTGRAEPASTVRA